MAHTTAGGLGADTRAVARSITSSKQNLLLLFVPVAVALDAAGAPDTWLFIASALAIVPLAGLIGRATQQPAARLAEPLFGDRAADRLRGRAMVLAPHAPRRLQHRLARTRAGGRRAVGDRVGRAAGNRDRADRGRGRDPGRVGRAVRAQP